MADASIGHRGTEADVILARVGAFVLDHVLSLVVSAVVGVGFALLLRSEAGIYLGVGVGYFGYFVVQEGVFSRTVGKRAAGIVVVGREGGPITVRQSLVRNLLRVVDGVLSYAVGLVFMLLGEQRQRLGDMTAETFVVRARH